MPTKFLTILLGAKGDTKQANIQCAATTPTAEEIHTYMRKKEAPDSQVKCIMKGLSVTLWGYKNVKGAKGVKNAHTLPVENDFIGDILVMVGDPVTPMKIKDWEDAGKKKTVKEATAVTAVTAVNIVPADEPDDIVPEDDVEDAEEDAEEEDAEEDADDDVAEEDDIEEPAIDEVEVEAEAEEEVRPKKKAAKKKPKLTTAFAKQQALLENDEFEEITPENYEPNEVTLQILREYFCGSGLEDEKIQDLETAIFVMAFNEAKKRHVISHWSNPLFKQLYRTICLRIISNLCPSSYVKNEALFEKVKSGEIEVAHLADFNSYDLYPEHWKEMEDRRIMREQAYMDGNKGRATDQFKCNRCKKSQCTYYEMQTRSADEPMTLFITCVNCGKRWRQ